ncbi:hypothetical protein LQG66_03995 [Bradyrhizobium ontarionense]|uniref:Histidine kinase n=1 Tax=Bradyrhizobium ontarionense TaxID=2898149 RepID=A0ABY3RFP2_9BRAD|nr:hypothetical protein [Bradyrhizobium sp. A19]UFZ05489.1 hypothetical protein LQG66_03995 [Bradyrhizobium sp. A19]
MHPLAKLIVAVRAFAIIGIAGALLTAWVIGPRVNHTRPLKAPAAVEQAGSVMR